ncbi:hypothetical protein F4V89_03940 [Neorhizobium galegae]|nr:hypothetical protein F4V88_16580 [Neorhizobium galegae]KAB1115583.1 hypothetical protein F4V89_03940 [Neorhizobium galegae]
MIIPLSMTKMPWPRQIITATRAITAARRRPGTPGCKGYCGVAAITCSGSSLSQPRVVSIREFVDDTDTVGEAPGLHRPLNI